MKNNLTLWVLLAFLTLLGVTNCTKEEDTTEANIFTEQTPQEIQNNQTAIIGSWQFVEKSVDVKVHTCPGTVLGNMSKLMIQWENVTNDEKRDFKQNGAYYQYSESATCQGSYKISENAVLQVISNCKSLSEKIVGLTSFFLTIKEGDNYFKYRKLN